MSIQATQRFMTVALAFALFVPVQHAWANEKQTARNKAIVGDFYTTVLIGRDVRRGTAIPAAGLHSAQP
jgi:hypothetical protein